MQISYKILLTALLIASFHAKGQELADSVQYSTDTTTVAVKTVQKKGPKVYGTVKDGGTGLPLSGVNISIPGFSATISDDKGEFAITVPDYRTDIIASMEGFHSKTYPVFRDKKLQVLLYPESFSSQYVSVSLATGSKPQNQIAGAVSTMNGRDWLANSETPGSNFQARLSGVNSVRRSGTNAIGAETFVRGFSSLYGNNKPLYVVDGMIYDASSYGNAISSGFSYNPLQFIDIRDIASVTVAKDAPLTAAYGSRAANGVVFISTARPKELATRIDFSAYGGFNAQPKLYPLMNAYDYRSYLGDVLASSGLTQRQIETLPYMVDDRNNPQYFATHNDSKWQNDVFRNAYNQNYYMSISGGDNVATYSLALGYLKNNGITDSTDYARYNTRFNALLNLSQKLSGEVHLGFTYAMQDVRDQGLSSYTNPLFLSLVKSPFFNRNEVGAGGTLSPKLADVDALGIGNPAALIANGMNSFKTYRFFGSTNFDYKFNKALKASLLVGLTYDKGQESTFVPRIGVSDQVIDAQLIESQLGSGTTRFSGLAFDTRLNYSKVFNKVHQLSLTAGVRYNDNASRVEQVKGYNSGTDQLISIGNSNSVSRIFNGRIGEWRTLNSYLTADYSFENRFLLNAAVAVDGSSRFGRQAVDGITINGNRYGIFPAVGAAWVVSSEEFMKNSKNVDLLKIRVSFGLLGNDDIGNYGARRYYVSQNLIGLQGLVRGNIANPALQWEAVEKLNLGTDISLFRERLSVTADLWQHHTSRMVTEQVINDVTAGYNSYLSNNASMKTTGMDLSLNTRILNGKVKWDAGFNIGTYKNEVLSLGSGSIVNDFAGGSYITAVSNTANLFYGYQTMGVYSTSAEAASADLSVRTSNGSLLAFTAGDMRFVDQNGDRIIDENDRVAIGDPNPDFYGGMFHSVSYKRWKLDALLSFVSGNDVYNYTRSQLESGTLYNQTPAMLNRWRVEGENSNIPKVSYGDPMGNGRFSDRWIEDGSYIRLRTLGLTYNIPLKVSALKYVTVYATGNNLLTLSKYKGFDPEFSAGEGIFRQGVDVTLEPQFRSFQLGIRLGL